MLTRDEILNILKRDKKIDITVRTFDFYRDKGLIPPIEGRRNRKGLYPNNTPDMIASIKKYQNDGMTLSNIKKLMNAKREKEFYESQLSELESKKRYLKGWDDPTKREQRLIAFLNLEDIGQKYDVGLIGGHEGRTFSFISVIYDEFIDFYKIQIDLEEPRKEKILGKKRLTPDGYKMIARLMVDSQLRLGKLLDKDDIFIYLFLE